MSEAEEALQILQKFVDGFTMDVGRVRAALDDPGTPESARLLLVGGLSYLLDQLDMFPDHYRGIGFADDAMVLRVAAALALAEGATARGLAGLAKEERDVEKLLGDLAEPVRKLVAGLPARKVRGRSAEQVLKDKDVRAVFDADLNRALKKMTPEQIDTGWMGAAGVVDELRKMIRHGLKKAGQLAG